MVYDVEKQHGEAAVSPEYATRSDEDIKAPSQSAFDAGSSTNSNVLGEQYGGGILGKLLSIETALDRKLGIESQAINRILPEEKVPQPWHQQATMALMWAG